MAQASVPAGSGFAGTEAGATRCVGLVRGGGGFRDVPTCRFRGSLVAFEQLDDDAEFVAGIDVGELAGGGVAALVHHGQTLLGQ